MAERMTEQRIVSGWAVARSVSVQNGILLIPCEPGIQALRANSNGNSRIVIEAPAVGSDVVAESHWNGGHRL
jgi:hypothetical protein